MRSIIGRRLAEVWGLTAPLLMATAAAAGVLVIGLFLGETRQP